MRSWILLTLLALVPCGCGSDEPLRKPTTPVSGQIVVDGQPPETPVKVTCHADSVDSEAPTFSQCFTDASGKFSVSTYETGDGVPAGSYTLTCEWGESNPLTMSYGGPDRLKGKYSDPKTSTHKFTVTEGQSALDLGKIEVSTK